jgi:long-chain fatty acid transport protein
MCAHTQSAASGFYVRVKDSIGTGFASAGSSARADDASTAFFNPAGMTLVRGRMIQTGIELITPDTRIENRGSSATTLGTGGTALPYPGPNGDGGSPTPVPHFYYVQPLSADTTIGVAVTAPFGLSINYASQWFGRYDSIKNRLTTVEIGPAIAWRVASSLSVGGGLNVQYADAALTNAIPNVLNPGGPTPETDGQAKLKGDGWAVGYNVGAHFHPTEATRIGAHYRSSMHHELHGDVTVSGLSGPLAVGNGTTGANTRFRIPWMFTAGIAQQLSPRWKVLAEVQRFGWGKFDNITIGLDGGAEVVRPQQFHNSTSVSVGAELAVNDAWTVRAGVRKDQTPTGSLRNTSIPDVDVVWLGVGASYRWSKRLKLDMGYLHGLYERADIDVNVPFFAGSPVAGSVNVKGRIDARANVLSFALRYDL